LGVVERQAAHGAAGKREHVEIAAAGARRHERELPAVGRKQRTPFVGLVRHQQARLAAAGGDRPDVAARRKRDLPAVW